MLVNKKDYEKVVEKTLKNGGYSQNTGRFMVAIEEYETIVPRETFNWKNIRDFNEKQNKGWSCLGTWFNKRDGMVYLDVSIPFEDKEKALKFAQDNNQLAIYNTKNNQTIYL